MLQLRLSGVRGDGCCVLPSVRCDGDYSTAADNKSGITALCSSVQAPLISIYWGKKIGIAKHCN